MTRIGILIGCAALAAATPGNAQLLGGGGGIGGGIGGGLGGSMSNIGGGIGGSLHSERLSETARTDRVRSRELRAERRRADRGIVGGARGSLPTDFGSLAGSGTASIAAATGSATVPATVDGRAVSEIRTRSYAIRTDAQAGARGLRRAGRSYSGVSIYLPATAIGVPVIAQSYPAYGGGYAYGGSYGYDAGYYRDTEVVVVPDQSYMDRQYRDLREDTAGTGVTVERRGEDLVVQLPADITFAFDRADIQPRFVAALDAVARTIAEYRGTDVEIVGHTDSVGSDAYNYALSQRRGSSVADFLVSRRAAPDRLIVEAMGESEPVATNATVAGRAANRRVEIILHPSAA